MRCGASPAIFHGIELRRLTPGLATLGAEDPSGTTSEIGRSWACGRLRGMGKVDARQPCGWAAITHPFRDSVSPADCGGCLPTISRVPEPAPDAAKSQCHLVGSVNRMHRDHSTTIALELQSVSHTLTGQEIRAHRHTRHRHGSVRGVLDEHQLAILGLAN